MYPDAETVYNEVQTNEPNNSEHNPNTSGNSIPVQQPAQTIYTVTDDYINGWLYVLAACVPIFSIIYYFVIKDEKPRCAKTMLQIFIAEVVVYAVTILFGILLPWMAIFALA